MEGLGDAETIGGETASGYGSTHVFEQRILCAGQNRAARLRPPFGHVYAEVSAVRIIAHMFRLLWRVALPAVIALASYVFFIASRIEAQSEIDEARRADVIIVMGAAEYRGRPSPVLRARIDHALDLYRRKLAPRILTTGGAGGDPVYTEGEVARNYLVRQGVPSEAILVENEAESTWQSTAIAGEMMRRMNLRSAIVVSDGYHIYRTKKMLEFRGIDVYGSPRPGEIRDVWRARWLFIRQAIGYILWQAGLTL
jgi:uncharacterized SAM-binding protein YcdF (DUF218 family)